MKIPFNTTLSEQDAVFAMHVHAESEVHECIGNFFNGDAEAGAKMLDAQVRLEKARQTWLAFCSTRYAKPVAAQSMALLKPGQAD